MTAPDPKQPIFRVGQEACRKGGDLGGQYLDGIGVTDLAKLTGEQWDMFLMKVVGGALLASVGDLYGGEAPF